MNTRSISGAARVPGTARRRLALLATASLALYALLGATAVSAAPLSGAVYTSNADGSIVNQNIYEKKSDVYLTGGPCDSGSQLDPGWYYFEVTNPSGQQLLSSDAIGNRLYRIGDDGFIAETSGTHDTHALDPACNSTGITIQMIPFQDTPNQGGEYKFTVATQASVEACEDFDAESDEFLICGGADQKSDNFKVGEEEPPPPPADPDIHVDKSADPTSLPVGGGSVTYTYEVTNPGNVPLSDVTVTDDTCSPVTYESGDENTDDLLDIDETWTYTCEMTLTVTTTNVVTAEGTYGEETVDDEDTATVTVVTSGGEEPARGTPSAKPTLPSTSTVDGEDGQGGAPLALVLVLLAAGAAAAVVLSPLPKGLR